MILKMFGGRLNVQCHGYFNWKTYFKCLFKIKLQFLLGFKSEKKTNFIHFQSRGMF